MNFNDVLYTVIGNRIMEGGSGSEFDLVYTFKEGRIYRGNAMYTSQIAYTIGQNGKIYKGNSTFELDVLYTVRDGVIYAGSSTFPGDAIYYIDGPYSPAELIGFLLSLDLISWLLFFFKEFFLVDEDDSHANGNGGIGNVEDRTKKLKSVASEPRKPFR